MHVFFFNQWSSYEMLISDWCTDVFSSFLAPGNCRCAGALASKPATVAIGDAITRGKDMSYFVTGATGFIGRFLVANLLRRKGTIHVLVRKDSQKKFDAIAKKMGWDPKRITVLHGDMAAARCGLTAAQVRGLKGKVKHFFHLAAIYDLDAKAEAQRVANVDGTQNALD